MQLKEVLNLLPDPVIIASNCDSDQRPHMQFANTAAAKLAMDNIDECTPEELRRCDLLERRLFEKRNKTKEEE